MTIFSDEVHYIFDAGTSVGDLTVDVGDALRLLAPWNDQIEWIVRRLDQTTSELCDSLTAAADQVWTQPADNLPLRRGLLAYAMAHATLQIGDAGAVVAHRLASMTTDYGRHAPRKKLVRRARSAHHQWTALRQQSEQSRLQKRFDRLLRLYRMHDTHAMSPDDVRAYEAANQSYWRETQQGDVENFAQLFDVSLLKRRQRNLITKEDRRSLKRAVKLAISIVGESIVEKFLRKQPVTIAGRHFHLEVYCHRIFNNGHGGLDITLCSTLGERLARLCVYFQKTPALDQLVALHLYFQAGMEDELIRKANVIEHYEAAQTHDHYAALRQQRSDHLASAPVPPSYERRFLDYSVDLCREIEPGMTEKTFIVFSRNDIKLARSLQQLYDNFGQMWNPPEQRYQVLPL